MGISWNGGTPQWMVYKGNSNWNGWLGGYPHFRNPPYATTLLMMFKIKIYCIASILVIHWWSHREPSQCAGKIKVVKLLKAYFDPRFLQQKWGLKWFTESDMFFRFPIATKNDRIVSRIWLTSIASGYHWGPVEEKRGSWFETAPRSPRMSDLLGILLGVRGSVASWPKINDGLFKSGSHEKQSNDVLFNW